MKISTGVRPRVTIGGTISGAVATRDSYSYFSAGVSTWSSPNPLNYSISWEVVCPYDNKVKIISKSDTTIKFSTKGGGDFKLLVKTYYKDHLMDQKYINIKLTEVG